jgi:hypothetical protein
MGPGVKNDVLLASISTNIHMNNGPILGQSGGKVIENVFYEIATKIFQYMFVNKQFMNIILFVYRGNCRR